MGIPDFFIGVAVAIEPGFAVAAQPATQLPVGEQLGLRHLPTPSGGIDHPHYGQLNPA